MNAQMIAAVKSARRVSTPLVGISTTDQFATVTVLAEALTDAALVEWDLARGMRPRNAAGKAALRTIEQQYQIDCSPAMTQNPGEVLGNVAPKLPAGAVLFMYNAPAVMREPVIVQSIANLRDEFKQDKRLLVLLGASITLSPELDGDIITFDEPLPSRDDLARLVATQYENAGLDKPAADIVTRAVDALMGLPAFTAEQVTAMSLTRTGLDFDALWERKRQAVERTPGLAIWRGKESFDGIGGMANIKRFLSSVIGGNDAPRAIVFIDEIEKALAGAGTDTSGTTGNQLGYLLSFMQDKQADGVLFIGHPGTSKSMIAKAAGNAAGIPTIALDLGGMKDSLVGASEARTRNALKVIESVSQGRALFIATCNSLASLPPELRRRFTMGTFFFDLPTAEERDAIWALYLAQFKLDAKQPRPDDRGWTGAEIFNTCKVAYRLKMGLIEAATYITPICKSAPERIEKLCREASGRFISASKPGTYTYDDTTDAMSAPAASAKPRKAGARAIDFDE